MVLVAREQQQVPEPGLTTAATAASHQTEAVMGGPRWGAAALVGNLSKGNGAACAMVGPGVVQSVVRGAPPSLQSLAWACPLLQVGMIGEVAAEEAPPPLHGGTVSPVGTGQHDFPILLRNG